MTQAVVGVFENQACASRAVEGLIEAHFRPRQEIAVLVVNDDGADKTVPVVRRTRVPFGLAVGIPVGALIGALVVATGVLPDVRLPWVGSLYASTWIAGLMGAAGGMALGALVGVLYGLGFWWDGPDFGRARERRGARIWVTVDATDLRGRASEARRIFRRAGALDVIDGDPHDLDPSIN
jgi:hypothetical protein